MFGREVLDEIAWEQIEDVLLLCTGSGHPSDEDLERWLERLAARDYKCLLVSARGPGGPNSQQRDRIGRFWKKSGRPVPPTVMLTDSAVARMVLTAISWAVGTEFKAMSESDWEGALAHVGSSCDPHRVAAAAELMQMELNQRRQRRVG